MERVVERRDLQDLPTSDSIAQPLVSSAVPDAADLLAMAPLQEDLGPRGKADDDLWSDVPDEWDRGSMSRDEQEVYDYFGVPNLPRLRPTLMIWRHDQATVLEYATELLRAIVEVPRSKEGLSLRESIKSAVLQYI